MENKSEENEIDLGITIGTEEEALWMKNKENVKAAIEAMEKDLKELPMRIKINREILDFIESKLTEVIKF